MEFSVQFSLEEVRVLIKIWGKMTRKVVEKLRKIAGKLKIHQHRLLIPFFCLKSEPFIFV
jgi:hypothetical protein